jgi:hypothetical protein
MAASPPNNLGPSPLVRPDFFAGVPQPLQLLELVAAFFGVDVRTVVRSKSTTVSTTGIAIDAYAGQRVGAIISNTGATQVVINHAATDTYPNGIAIPAGLALTLSWYEDMQLLNYPLFAVSTGAGTTVHIWENVLAGS